MTCINNKGAGAMSCLHMTLAILAVVKSCFLFEVLFCFVFFLMEMDSSADKSEVNVYKLLIMINY